MAINILDSVIANRISAGEVVEKPASIPQLISLLLLRKIKRRAEAF